jgi:hypothetical protein
MKRLFASLLVVGAVAASAAAAPAMPLMPDRAPSGIIIQAAGGCGIGLHRGPYGACRRNGYYGGAYYGGAPPGVRVPPGPYPCGGRGQHRVCNGMGACWMACN